MKKRRRIASREGLNIFLPKKPSSLRVFFLGTYLSKVLVTISKLLTESMFEIILSRYWSDNLPRFLYCQVVYIYIYMNNFHLITFLLISLAVVSIWLALSSVLYSRIAIFPPKSHLLPSQWGCNNKTKQPIRFPGVLTVTKQIVGNWKAKSQYMANFATFKILVLVKIL